MSNIPEGWTDDMSVPLPSETSVDDVAKFVMEASFLGKNEEDIINELVSTHGISFEDGDLILDRIFGGIFRASTNNSLNRPNAQKDPFAYSSYDMAIKNREIIAFFYPERVQEGEKQIETTPGKEEKRPWWKFW
jgi:hypothetical protein